MSARNVSNKHDPQSGSQIHSDILTFGIQFFEPSAPIDEGRIHDKNRRFQVCQSSLRWMSR